MSLPAMGMSRRHATSSSVTVISPIGRWKLLVSSCHLSVKAQLAHERCFCTQKEGGKTRSIHRVLESMIIFKRQQKWQVRKLKFLPVLKSDNQHLLDIVAEIDFEWRKNDDNRIWRGKNCKSRSWKLVVLWCCVAVKWLKSHREHN